MLAFCALGSLPAGADTAKRFERGVAPVFGACEEEWSIPPNSVQNAEEASRRTCKYFMTVIKKETEKIIRKSSRSPPSR